MPHHRRNLALVIVAMALSFVAQSITLLAVPLYASSLGAPPAAIGLLVATAFALPTVFAIPMGRLVTRLGVRRMMTLGAAGMALAPTAVLVAPGFGGLLVLQLLIGTTQLAMGISAQATVAASARGPALERAFGWYTTAASIGQMIGPLAGGLPLDVALTGLVGDIAPLALGAFAQFSGYGPMFVFAGVRLLGVLWALLARLPAYVRLARSEAG